MVGSNSTLFQVSPSQSPHTHTHTRVHSTAFLHPVVSVSLPTAYSAVDHIPFAVNLILFLPFSLFIPTMMLPNAATNTRTERHVVIRLYNNCSMSDHYRSPLLRLLRWRNWLQTLQSWALKELLYVFQISLLFSRRDLAFSFVFPDEHTFRFRFFKVM